MTESEWQTATDAGKMLAFLGEARLSARKLRLLSARKLRLFAVACARRIEALLAEDAAQLEALAVAERFCEGEATSDELAAARRAAADDYRTGLGGGAGYYTAQPSSWGAAQGASLNASERAGDSAFRAAEYAGTNREDALETARLIAAMLENKAQADLLRCLVGNPFHPNPTLDPAWLSANGGAVPALATAIYEDRAFDRLPILADALEEAGCTDAEVLRHCRDAGPHARGCWVIDWLLMKEPEPQTREDTEKA